MKGCEYLLKLFCDYFDCLDDGFDVLCLACRGGIGMGVRIGMRKTEKLEMKN